MILSIGEILADMIGELGENGMVFKVRCGGAPFNMAVNAKRAGAKVAFLGRVGDDPIGRFLKAEAAKAALDELILQIDQNRNTTLAFVSLNEGERDFSFFRRDTADYCIEVEELNFEKYADLKIVHLGSLMLSEKMGRKTAQSVIEKTRKAGKLLSFDFNFRKDLFKDMAEAAEIFGRVVEQADILKFSEEELKAYTGVNDLETAIERVYKKNTILLVTLGSRGSMYRLNELCGMIATKRVEPIDTTGAGDAFYGTFVAEIENRPWDRENIEYALIKANEAGALTTQFFGAIRL